MKNSKRPGLILAALVTLLLLGLYYFRRDLGTAYVASQFRSATDADAELEAARKINAWTRGFICSHGYKVQAQDAQGNEIKPHLTGNYDAVAVIKITWGNGTTVERKILNPKSPSYIYGE
jgi:hypothetical protein